MPMDGDKHSFVVESIRKLLSLNVSDKEILENLYDVGIQKEEALALIAEARGPAKQAQPVVSSQRPAQQQPAAKPGPVIEGSEASSDLSVGDQIIGQLDLEEDKASVQPAPAPAQKRPETIMASEVDFGVKVKESKKFAPQEQPRSVPKEISSSVPAGLSSAAAPKPSQPKPVAPQPVPFPSLQKPAPSASQQKPLSPLAPQQKPQTPSSMKPFVQQLSYAKQLEMELADTEKELSEEGLPVGNLPEEGAEEEEEEELAEQIEEGEEPAAPAAVPSVQAKPSISPAESAAALIAKEKASQPPQKLRHAFSEPKASSQFGPVSGPELEEIWKKGIIVAVNAKMSEMKRLKDDIEDIIEEQVDAAVSKELIRFKVLMDSQKDLIISSNKEALEQKQREIDFIIDAKISELKQYNKELSSNLEALQRMKGDQQLTMQQVTSSLGEARKLKSQLIIEMNSELMKSKSSAQNFIDQANTHLAEIDGRVNKTLELEKNIAEGMLQQAEQKIETMTIQKADELIADLEVEVNRLKTIEKKISPETIEQKIRVLDEFKKQFLSSMQENLAQINIAIQDLNTKNALAEQQLKEKTLAIDAKVEELTRFEKEFSKRLNALFKGV